MLAELHQHNTGKRLVMSLLRSAPLPLVRKPFSSTGKGFEPPVELPTLQAQL